MSNTEQPKDEYIPFGTEWAKEIKKMPKDIIIEMLADANKKRQVAEAKSAAAPDLLEACQSFMELFKNSDMRPEDECYELADKIQSAITKALTINQH